MIQDLQVYIVEEVINYGGFFAGDTITLTASPVDAPDERHDFTIDDYAFDNLRDRYQVTPGVTWPWRRTATRCCAPTSSARGHGNRSGRP